MGCISSTHRSDDNKHVKKNIARKIKIKACKGTINELEQFEKLATQEVKCNCLNGLKQVLNESKLSANYNYSKGWVLSNALKIATVYGHYKIFKYLVEEQNVQICAVNVPMALRERLVIHDVFKFAHLHYGSEQIAKYIIKNYLTDFYILMENSNIKYKIFNDDIFLNYLKLQNLDQKKIKNNQLMVIFK